MPDFTAAIALLKKPIEEIYSAASGVVKDKIAYLRTTAKAKSLHKKLYENQRVKTIWNTDRALSLTSFFYPVSIENSEGSKRLTSLDDLRDRHNIIFGTVGQGKSILLKYLLGKEIKSGLRIPVLAELRNINNETLEEFLCGRFCLLLGINYDFDVFVEFSKNGKLSLLLDGFDEIDGSLVKNVTQQIEDLSYKYDLCKIVLTSRPDAECRYLTKFTSYKIKPLSEENLEPFYKKITKDSDFIARLMAAINLSPLKIHELVKTPLLATLLAISYRASQRIPLEFSEFYEILFQTLLVRHDASKLGWRRQRKTALNDRIIQQAFEAFCFAARKKKIISIDRETAFELAKSSIEEIKCNTDPQLFIDDIKNITCLLLDDGKKISFVHLSVQEFFASCFIKRLPDSASAIFYEQLLKGKWSEWREEILFLQEIDTHRANKYFLLPDLDVTLNHLINLKTVFDNFALNSYLEGISVVRNVVSRDGNNETRYHLQRTREIHTQHYQYLDDLSYEVLFSKNYRNAKLWIEGFKKTPESYKRNLLQIAIDREGDVLSDLSTRLSNKVAYFIKEREKLKNKVSFAEKHRDFIDIS